MITIDATALTFDAFRIPGVGQFPTHTPQVLDLAPGRYRFGTLYGAEFEFSVDDAGIVNYNKDFTFLTGTGTGGLTVLGCKIQVDATALTFDSFGLYDSASGLNHGFPSTSVQVVRLIPGHYRFGTLYGAVFDFTVTNGCTVDYDPGLTFLTGAGTGVLEVVGFLVNVDARSLAAASFELGDSASGLAVSLPTARPHCVTLIPGSYVFRCGFAFGFSISTGGTFDFDPAFVRCVSGLGRQRVRVLCDPTGP